MARCDPNTILAKSAASCYQCLDRGVLAMIKTQLICNWAQTVTPPPVTGNFRITDNGGFRLTDNGGFRVVA